MTLPNSKELYMSIINHNIKASTLGTKCPMPLYLQKNPLQTLILLEGTRAYYSTPRYPELDIVIGLSSV